MKQKGTIVGLALSVMGLAMMPGRSIAAGEVDRYPSVVALEETEPTDAEDAPAGDLVYLARWIGDAAIVGLGEGSHGTHTLHRLAHRIFQHLVENEGFKVFALEIDQAHAAILDEYVQGDRDDLDRQIVGGWWGQRIFYNHSFAFPERRNFLSGAPPLRVPSTYWGRPEQHGIPRALDRGSPLEAFPSASGEQ